MLEAELSKHFTDLDGRFEGRLAAVYSMRRTDVSAETTGFSAKYECRVKAQYQKDLMGLLEEGMLLAVRNFKAKKFGGKRYTLLEISRIGPEHFGLRGLSDQNYYPYQFEIIEQSVADWDTDDRATMIIQLNAIPLNYDLILDGENHRYVKGFTYPVVGELVHILNKATIHRMYNRKLLEELGLTWNERIVTSSEARKDPRIGTIKMFQEEDGAVPIYVSFEKLVRYHFGVFSFTGGGKSNLLSNILRRILYHSKQTKIVIFDISMEYPFLLQDVFLDKSIKSKIIAEIPVADARRFGKIMVTPRGFEKYDVSDNIETIINQGKLGHYQEASKPPPTYESILEQIRMLEREEGDKRVNADAMNDIEAGVLKWIKDNSLERSTIVSEDFLDFLQAHAIASIEKFKVWKSGSLAAWANTRAQLKSTLSRSKEGVDKDAYTPVKLLQLLRGDTRLLCLSIAEPNIIKNLAITLTSEMLRERKREFQVDPQILFVFDEAQEFIPAYDKARGIDQTCTNRIETLLRQGRKYGLGGCVATQRIAYLNTNALQQLHTYFVGPLPRPYDRSLVSSTFTIDQGILEKTLEFAPGQWLLSSYIATGMENVPIFISADNSETELRSILT
ncbi:MAG TPA: ATP-binding protein [Terriglobales bacterium]|nr:ATP-binding protein [Terriglobales bacterium]